MAKKKINRKYAASQPGLFRDWLDKLFDFFIRFERFAWDIGGVLSLAVALMTALAVYGFTGGALLDWWSQLLQRLLGQGNLLVVLVFAVLGIYLLRQPPGEPTRIPWARVLLLEGAAFALLALLTLLGGASVQRAAVGLDGGWVGWGLAELLSLMIQPDWLLIGLLSLVFLLCTVVGLELGPALIALGQSVRRRQESAGRPFPVNRGAVSVSEMDEGASQPVSGEKPRKGKTPRLPAEFRKQFRIQLNDETNAKPPPRDDRLPSLDLLADERAARPDERHINLTAGLIEKTLAEFGIPAKVIGFQVGPTVTQFAVEPGYIEKSGNPEEDRNRQKVRVAQISSLSRDLALALSAERLRIEAPVPGRPFVGVEVPNSKSSLVRLRPILETEAFYKFGSPLTIALGRDVSGQAVVADLGSMPHLLIAGTTGSGKSVGIAALTTCLVMNNTPEDLRLVMIDPKMVELVRFNGLPHLFGKVETDLERILGVLRWTVAEMDRRYKLLEIDPLAQYQLLQPQDAPPQGRRDTAQDRGHAR